MKILVTGGTGYVGSHTTVLLIQEGYEVVILDNLCNSKVEVLDGIEKITGVRPEFYNLDLLNYEDVNKIFDKHVIEGVVHFANLKAVGESVRMPLLYYNNNITGTINLLQIMKKNNVKNIIFSSSATVYGINNTSPLVEAMPLCATNPYGTTKIIIENILQDLYASDDAWSVVSLRYFNPIGAHESAILGENPNGAPSNLLPYIALVATEKLDHLSVFGGDYDTADGTGVRDYVHIMDLARGHIKALEYVLANRGVEAINLGTGNGTSVLEVIAAFEKASGKKVEYKICPRREGDVATSFADVAKAKKILGWEATKDINDMCMDLWKFVTKADTAEKYY